MSLSAGSKLELAVLQAELEPECGITSVGGLAARVDEINRRDDVRLTGQNAKPDPSASADAAKQLT
jgi:hypothetical protein